MTPLYAICAICGTSFVARTSYGLCKDCYSRDRLREWDRVLSATRYAEQCNVPANLTLVQWLSTLSDFRAQCGYCQEASVYSIDMVNFLDGLTWLNVVPICKSCAHIKKIGFEVARLRVQQYLTANENRTEDDANLEYHYEDDDHEPYILGPMPEWMQRSPIFKNMKVKQENTRHD